MFGLNFLLTVSSVVLGVLMLSLVLLGSLQGMSGLLVRMFRLVSVFFLAPPSLSGRLCSFGTFLGMVAFGRSAGCAASWETSWFH